MSAPTPHLSALPGEIAPIVLLPGDPLRAEFIADTYLQGARCHNRVRNMLGFTGTYEGIPVSVQGTGMGIPSISIYVTELLRFHGVHTAIRIGSCGALRDEVQLRDVVLASSAHTNSAVNRRHFRGIDYAPTSDFGLLATAHRIAGERHLRTHVGPVYTSDLFYDDDPEVFALLAAHGTLAVEMEAAALLTIAAREGARALCIATVSDHIIRHEAASAEERQTGFSAMVELALETAVHAERADRA